MSHLQGKKQTPIGIKPAALLAPWVFDYEKYAEWLLKSVDAGSGYIYVTACFHSIGLGKGLEEIKRRGFPIHFPGQRLMKAETPGLGADGAILIFGRPSVGWIEGAPRLLELLEKRLPDDIHVIANLIGPGEDREGWAEGAKRFEGLNADFIIELHINNGKPFYTNNHHETSRKPDATGEAAPTSDSVAGDWRDLAGGGSTNKLLHKLRFSMATGLSRRRGEGVGLQSLSAAFSQAFGTREEAIGGPFAKRSCGSWLRHRSLYHKTGGRSNSQGFCGSVPYQPSLATSDGVGMELSKARTPGSGKERGGDRTLEEETVAGNKKRHRTWSPSGLS